jgi:hypothetical protein
MGAKITSLISYEIFMVNICLVGPKSSLNFFLNTFLRRKILFVQMSYALPKNYYILH